MHDPFLEVRYRWLFLSLCCLRSTSCHIFTLWELAAFMYKIMFMLFRTQKRHSLGDYFCSYSLKSTNGNLKRSNHFDESVQQGGLSPPPGWDNQYNEWVLRLTLLPNVAFLFLPYVEIKNCLLAGNDLLKPWASKRLINHFLRVQKQPLRAVLTHLK